MVKVWPSNLFVHLPYNHSTNLLVNRILHVRTIYKNFASVSQFTRDNSVTLEFHPNVCLVKSPIRWHVKWKTARSKKTGHMTSEIAKEIVEKIVSPFQLRIVIIFVYSVSD